MKTQSTEKNTEDIANEKALLEQEVTAYEEGLRKYWFDPDLQIQIRENLNQRIQRIAELTQIEHDR